jgi:hypothetical protein
VSKAAAQEAKQVLTNGFAVELRVQVRPFFPPTYPAMSNWIELFNGTDLSGWTARQDHTWAVGAAVALNPVDAKQFVVTPGGGILYNGPTGRTRDLQTVLEHGSCELHVEFCVPEGSNSGVYLMGQYEIQILDSWGTPDSELKFGTNGGIYGRWIEETKTPFEGFAPITNASRAPGEWQCFEIRFHAPRFDAAGRKIANARFERIVHNGTVIHENRECTGPTRGAWSDEDIPRGPLRLQGDHGPVAYRNVRLHPLPEG